MHSTPSSSAYGAGSFSGGAAGTKPGGTLYLMVGYPGAGKTTVAKLIAELTGATRISSDEMRMKFFPRPTFSPKEHDELYRQIDAKVVRFLGDGKSVVYDANLNRYIHRKQKYELCSRMQAVPKLIWIQTPRKVAKDRAVHPDRSHLVPEHETADRMFDRIADIIEEPDASENPIIIDGQNVSEATVKQALGL